MQRLSQRNATPKVVKGKSRRGDRFHGIGGELGQRPIMRSERVDKKTPSYTFGWNEHSSTWEGEKEETKEGSKKKRRRGLRVCDLSKKGRAKS